MNLLDHEITHARQRTAQIDRQAPGSFGAGHQWGYLEGLLRARELLRGPALAMTDDTDDMASAATLGVAPGRGRARQRTETT